MRGVYMSQSDSSQPRGKVRERVNGTNTRNPINSILYKEEWIECEWRRHGGALLTGEETETRRALEYKSWERVL